MVIDGTPEPDSLDDTPGDDMIDAGAGDDAISVTNGHDEVDGGIGNDALTVLWADSTFAIVNEAAAGGFSLRLVGGPTRSVDIRNVETLLIEAGSGNDNITGGAIHNRFFDVPPDAGSNRASGDDVFTGGAGHDYFEVATGNDSVDGGSGTTDYLVIRYDGSTDPIVSLTPPAGFQWRYESGAGRSVNLVGIERVEIFGGSANDILTGLGGSDIISDGPGTTFDNDILKGAGGFDQLGASGGHDLLDGGSQNDSASLAWTNSSAPIVVGVAPAGYDIRFESGTDYSANLVSIEHITILGGSGNDVVVTRGGDDRFLDSASGASGDDYFEGGAGADYHDIRSGHDRSDGGADFDNTSIDWSDSLAPVVTTTPTAGYEIRFESGSARSADLRNIEAITLYGGIADDVVTLGASSDIVYANIGNDIVDGGGGDDFLEGEDGADTLTGGAARDSLFGGSGDDTLRGDDGDDFLEGEDGADALAGGAGSDNLDGGSGDDTLHGDGGDDYLVAGSGVDTMFGEEGDDAGLLSDDSDSFTGGAGTDTAIVAGQYASFTVRISPDTEVLLLASGTDGFFASGSESFDYNIIFPNAPAGSDSILTVQATDLVAGEDLKFDGSAQQNGAFRIFAGRGVDQLIGGNGNDGFFFDADANGSLTGADRIDGGGGRDTIALRGNYIGAKAVIFGESSMTAVDVVTFLSGHENPHGGPIDTNGFDYAVTMANANVAPGARLDVIGATLRSNESVSFDGRAETDGTYRIILGAGDDVVFGGQGADLLHGGLGADQMDGGGGADIYSYRQLADSTAASTDRIVLGDGDRIDLSFLDADSGAGGNQAFNFIGAQAFGNVAGELRAVQSGNFWVVEGDANGDGVADLVIHVTSADPIVAGDFFP